ncbi:MAG: hypothetical protein RR917_00820, partial [Eggerthellaceae bacterium]
CPYNEAETYPWTIGLFATNNRIKAYGLPASQQPLTLEETPLTHTTRTISVVAPALPHLPNSQKPQLPHPRTHNP